MFAVAGPACSDDDDGGNSIPTGTPSPTPRSLTPTPSPTSILGGPEFSGENALEHDRVLSVDIGPRPAGTESEKRAADYILGRLASYGYTASLQPFTIEQVADAGSLLQVISPESRSIPVRGLGGTVSAVVEGPILSAGLGYPQQMPIGARGSILLMERGEITFTQKMSNAEAAGALGIIVYNNQAGDLNGQLLFSGGIPAAGISQSDGEALVALIASGPATVRLETKMRTDVSTSHNVIATPPDGTCSVVAGGHFDSVPEGPGANDNGSGTSVVLEMARTRAANEMLDGVCYVLFGAEEIGLLGSAHYVQSLSSEQVSALEGMLNFDMLGVGDQWPLIGSPEITPIAGSSADRLGIAYTIEPNPPEDLGSDHINFINAGVPSILFNCFCDENYHSSRDTVEFIKPERLSEAGEIGLGMIEELLQP